MFDEDLQDALAKLDKSVPLKRRYGLPALATVVFTTFAVAMGTWSYQSFVPDVSQDRLMRMIVIASRGGEVDPVRLLMSVEEKLGKKADKFNGMDRAQAVEYLIDEIDLQKSNKEWVVY
ncbi:hypothetical protein [Terasakiella pusilla]|jgi:hypothetical protein|uniref:hypothetical protein n=1 Tax=Terasakiella pusilla TaxID=64973 RepID=UPI00048AC0A0|nr:hypothetical protein [Terasakiella pusilla]